MNNTKGKERRDNKSRRLCLLHKKDKEYLSKFAVVPHAGTWIEISLTSFVIISQVSFPTRERGLKSSIRTSSTLRIRSFPTRERGLKLSANTFVNAASRRSPRGNVD